MFEVLYSISLLVRDGLFFLAHNRFLEVWLLNIPVQGTSQEFCTKPRPTTHSRDGRRFGVYSESRKYYDNPTKRRVMLLLASKQIAALVEIQTFKSSSNITASLRQHLTLGVKYSYCFFYSYLGKPVLAGLTYMSISLNTLYVFTSSVFVYNK